MQKRLNKKGFTLIELIVVMAILAILVLLASPRFLGYTKDAKVTAMQQDAKVLSNAALQYNIKTERFPVEYEGEKPKVATDLSTDVQEAITKAVGADALTSIAEINKDAVDTDGPNKTGVAFSDLIKNTKNDISNYYIITEGKSSGEVFYSENLENSSNQVFNGVYEITTPVSGD